MPQKIDTLFDIAGQVDAFFIDVYGTLFDGKAYYPAALAVCQRLMASGKKIFVLSNATTISSYFKQKHAALGLLEGVHYTDIITSGDAFKHLLETQDFLSQIAGSTSAPFLLIGRGNDRLLASVLNRQTRSPDKVACAYVGALQDENGGRYETLEAFLPAARAALAKKVPLICSNPDFFAFEGDKKYVTPGCLAQWYEQNGGRVVWIGKPYPYLYEYALARTGSVPQTSAMVGDTVRTDILGGAQAGMRTVLITGTGVSADALKNGETLESLAQKEGATPDFLIDFLQ